MDFWISEWISEFRWISGFQVGFLPTVCEISFVADPSAQPSLASQTHFRKRGKGLVNCVYKPCPTGMQLAG